MSEHPSGRTWLRAAPFRRRERTVSPALLIVAVVAMIALTNSARAQTFLGPNDVCSAETMMGDWGGVRTRLDEYGIGFALQEQTEVWGNLKGGIKPGTAYDGLTSAGLCIDGSKAMHWPGATIFASGFQIYGPGPSKELVGPLQLISGIEATPSTKLYDVWFEQQLFGGKVLVRFGQQGANDEFMLAPYASIFLNSSFGYPAILALDLPSGGPNYPLAVPFVRLFFAPVEQISLIAGSSPMIPHRRAAATRNYAIAMGPPFG